MCSLQAQDFKMYVKKSRIIFKFNGNGISSSWWQCSELYPCFCLSSFITAVAIFWKPNAIPLCFSIGLVSNFLLSWLLVLFYPGFPWMSSFPSLQWDPFHN
jgi:hypothetical protein